MNHTDSIDDLVFFAASMTPLIPTPPSSSCSSSSASAHTPHTTILNELDLFAVLSASKNLHNHPRQSQISSPVTPVPSSSHSPLIPALQPALSQSPFPASPPNRHHNHQHPTYQHHNHKHHYRPSPAPSRARAPIRKPKTYSAPIASRFCHICSRMPRRGGAYSVCANMGRGLCRKMVCERCMAEQGWASGPDWVCPHCAGDCPKRSQCHIYNRINARRRKAGDGEGRGRGVVGEGERDRRDGRKEAGGTPRVHLRAHGEEMRVVPETGLERMVNDEYGGFDVPGSCLGSDGYDISSYLRM